MDYKVIISASKWDVGGVTVFSENLARGLQARSIPAEILLTQPYMESKNPLPLPEDIHISKLAVTEKDTWETHWKVFTDYLESQAPCIYIPNHDYRHSCASPRLSRRVGIVGVLHSDESIYYDHAVRLGRYWNAIVAVSKTIEEKTARIDPTLASRMYAIPCGVAIPRSCERRPSREGQPLRITYAGRIIQHQKRIMDLPKIMAELVNRQVMAEWTIIGSGPQQDEFTEALQPLIRQGASIRFLGARPNGEVLAAFEGSDVFILTSEFEGTPMTLMEAMGRGCVPVVSDIASGIPELIENGVNGYRIEIGDIEGFADRLEQLQRDASHFRSMSERAYAWVDEGRYRIEDMVDRYIEIFEQVMADIASARFQRPAGDIVPPQDIMVSWERQKHWKRRLPEPVLQAGSICKKLLRHLGISMLV